MKVDEVLLFSRSSVRAILEPGKTDVAMVVMVVTGSTPQDMQYNAGPLQSSLQGAPDISGANTEISR